MQERVSNISRKRPLHLDVVVRFARFGGKRNERNAAANSGQALQVAQQSGVRAGEFGLPPGEEGLQTFTGGFTQNYFERLVAFAQNRPEIFRSVSAKDGAQKVLAAV